MTIEAAITLWLIIGLIGTLGLAMRSPIRWEAWPLGACLGPVSVICAIIDWKDNR